MKKLNFHIFILLFFVLTTGGISSTFAQSAELLDASSCACSNSGCSASQSCPDGYIAVCTCSATGCSSSCSSSGFVAELSEKILSENLRNESVKNFGKILSKAFGKVVTFEPTDTKFQFTYSGSDSLTASHWDILEYLAKNGNLKINGHNLDFWKGYRQTLLKGGEISFCTGNAPAELVLAEISFITGKKYSITSGNPKAKISGAIKGESLNEIILNLSRMAQITIVEN